MSLLSPFLGSFVRICGTRQHTHTPPPPHATTSTIISSNVSQERQHLIEDGLRCNTHLPATYGTMHTCSRLICPIRIYFLRTQKKSQSPPPPALVQSCQEAVLQLQERATAASKSPECIPPPPPPRPTTVCLIHIAPCDQPFAKLHGIVIKLSAIEMPSKNNNQRSLHIYLENFTRQQQTPYCADSKNADAKFRYKTDQPQRLYLFAPRRESRDLEKHETNSSKIVPPSPPHFRRKIEYVHSDYMKRNDVSALSQK